MRINQNSASVIVCVIIGVTALINIGIAIGKTRDDVGDNTERSKQNTRDITEIKGNIRDIKHTSDENEKKLEEILKKLEEMKKNK